MEERAHINDVSSSLRFIQLIFGRETASEYVAEVYGYSYTGSNLTIIMEYFHKGDLFNLLHKVQF